MVGTSSALSTEASLRGAAIVVGNRSEWLVLLVPKKKNMCTYFNVCLVSLHECLFTRVGLQLNFTEIEIAIPKHLKVAPSQHYLGSWAYMRSSNCVMSTSIGSSLLIYSSIFSQSGAHLLTSGP